MWMFIFINIHAYTYTQTYIHLTPKTQTHIQALIYSVTALYSVMDIHALAHRQKDSSSTDAHVCMDV